MTKIVVPSTTSLKTYKPSIITDLWYTYFDTLFDNMYIFHFLTEVIIVRNNISQIKSGMRKNVFSYSKIGIVPVSLVLKQIVRITAIHSI